MRDAFSTELIKLFSKDPKAILLTGDHGYGLFDSLRKKHSDQYLNVGVQSRIWSELQRACQDLDLNLLSML